MKLAEIKSNPNNPRLIKDDKFQKLVNSIKEFPKMMALRPIVIDNNNMVLGGNMRLKALQELKYKTIPDEWVKKADELTDEEKQRFIIADNVGFGEMDWDLIANEWSYLPLEDWGVDLPVITQTELEAVEDDYEIPEEIKTDIVLGDLFEIGEHRLLCGDSTQTDSYHKLMNGQFADMVITDPPYNVAYEGKTKDKLTIKNDKQSNEVFYQFLYDFYTACATIVKKGGAWYVWHADSEGGNFRFAMKNAGILVKQCLIWVKSSMVMGRQDYQWKHEPCLYGWKDGASHTWYSDRKQTTVLNFDRPNRNAEHPTMKPIPLFAYQINNSSKQGDIVVDCFAGGGTSLIACHQMDRKAYLMELDPKYCQVIIDRMLKLDPNIEIKRNGKPYIKSND